MVHSKLGDTETEVFEYIEMFYNHVSHHERFVCLYSMDIEKNFKQISKEF